MVQRLKKFWETLSEKSCSIILFPLCSQFSLIRVNYFYGVHKYFVILSIEKFYDVVYWKRSIVPILFKYMPNKFIF